MGVRVVAPEEAAVGPGQGQGEGQGPGPGREAGRRRQVARTSATLRGRGGELPEEAGGLRCKAPKDVEGEGDEMYDRLTASPPVSRLHRGGSGRGRMTRANLDQLAREREDAADDREVDADTPALGPGG